MSLSDKAKLAVLDDLLQETGGLWVVIGSNYYSSWVTGVCTSEAQAQDLKERCNKWFMKVQQCLRNGDHLLSSGGAWEGSEIFVYGCPDQTLFQPGTSLESLSNAIHWRIERFCAKLVGGEFAAKPPPRIRERYGEIVCTIDRMDGEDMFRVSVDYKDLETGELGSLRCFQRTRREAVHWMDTRIAFFEGREPLDELDR